MPAPLPLAAPASIAASVLVLTPDSPEYALAGIDRAVRPPGGGNVSRAMVVQLTRDMPVYRMWDGPERARVKGESNRIGSWWTYDAPRGNQRDYRRNYAVCVVWNALNYVANCTLRKGAVVAIGPGNSVSAQTCKDATGRESYPANERHWQLYVSEISARIGPGKELECPDEAQDYQADPANLARRKTPAR